MIISPPIRFDDSTVFVPDGNTHSWSKKSGYDSNNRRITNLVGHNGNQFIKRCPHCGGDLPETYFGYDGRDTGERTRRDQSNCTDCRGRYNR